MTNWFYQIQTKFTHIKPLTIALCACLSLSFLTLAQAEATETKDPNAFDEKSFRLNLAEYLGKELMEDFKNLGSNNKIAFQNNFTSILRQLWKKTTINGEKKDTLEVIQPFIKAYVSVLRSLDYAGTQPQQKFQDLMNERNLLFTKGVFLPTDVEKSLSNLKEATYLIDKTREKCDINGDGISWVDEVHCADKVELEYAQQKGAELDKSIAEGKQRWAELDKSIAEGKQRWAELDKSIAEGKQRLAELINDIKQNIE